MKVSVGRIVCVNFMLALMMGAACSSCDNSNEQQQGNDLDSNLLATEEADGKTLPMPS